MLLALDIERVEPLADGAPFGEAGPYERVIATARGEVDPAHPGNSGIALIDKAPRPGARGHQVAFLHPSALGGTLVELVSAG